MVAAPVSGPSRPPANIEDFLWNVHLVLVHVATSGTPLPLDQLKEAYSKHLGHKCVIERFLVVGDGGLAATLKRIPHIVTIYQDNGVTFVRAAQSADTTKQQLIEADQNYRRELLKKSAAAKANAAKAKAKPPAAAPAAPTSAVEVAPVRAAPAPTGVADGQARTRPADGQPAGEPAAKKAKDDSDSDTLARMLVQGVVRVLQNRQKANKGPLPLGELEDEFKALWKVPFNLQQAGEKDAVSFLQKWSNKVELVLSNDGTQLVQLPRKNQANAAKAAPAPAKADAPSPTAAKAASVGVNSGAKAHAEATSPVTAAKSGAASPGVPKKTSGPSRPPASIEDFLWNIHTVIDSYGGPMPLDTLKEAYSKLLGHKCAIERFLVVGEGGLAATLRRIPHVVTVFQESDTLMLKAALAQGTTKEQLVQADLTYRRQLQQKNMAAKAQAAQNAGSPAKATTAPATTPAAVAATPPAPAPPVAEPATPAAGTSPAKAPPTTTVNEKRTDAPEVNEKRTDAPEAGAKRARTEDADTLARMLVQGIVRILQNRQKSNTGPLPIDDLDEEFKALWKVPFNLQQAGETDAVTFLQKWPNKVEVFSDASGRQLVQLAKKVAEKGKAPPAATKAATPVTVQETSQAAAISAAVVLPDPSPATSVESSAPATDAVVRPERIATPSQVAPSQAAVAPASTGANGLVAAPVAEEVSAMPLAPTLTPEQAAKLRRAQELEKTLPELLREATSNLQGMQGNLQAMKVVVQKQEALVASLTRCLSEPTLADRS